MKPVKRLLAISDMHGQIELFNALLKKIDYQPEQDLLFLLGDYIDRGANPKAVLKKAQELQLSGAICLKGNHEDMMEKALTEPTEENLTHWITNGGAETLLSYSLDPHSFSDDLLKGHAPHLPEDLANGLQWIQQLELYVQTDHYLFVHAGINPDLPLEKQNKQDLLWIREPFFNNYEGDKTVIFGHTPTSLFHESNDIYFGENRIIGIDGGAVFGGQLNCLELPAKTVWSVS